MSISPHPDVYFAYKAGSSLRDATVTRSDAGGYRDRTGLYQTKAANVARLEWDDDDGDGVHEIPATLLEGARTNLIADSDDLTAWTASGTPVVTATAFELGTLDLTRVEDDDGAATEFVHQTATFTGDDVKAVSFFIREGNTLPATRSEIKLWDNTAGADRLRIDVTGWTNGAPTLVATTGTIIRTVQWGLDVYRVECQTTSVTAANTNRVEVRPAPAAVGETGDILVGGVQCEDAPYPSSLIRTSGGTASRGADQIDQSYDIPLHKSWGLYCKCALLHGTLSSIDADAGLIMLRDSDSANRLQIFRDDATAQIHARWESTTEGLVTASFTPPASDPLEIMVRHDASDHHLEIALDGGSFSSGAVPTSQKPFTQGITTVRFMNTGYWKIKDSAIKVLSGLLTWDEARNAPTSVGV